MPQHGTYPGVARVDFVSLREEPPCLVKMIRDPRLLIRSQRLVTLHRQIVGCPGTRGLPRHAFSLRITEVGNDDPDDRLRDLVLNGKNISERAIEPLGPLSDT